MSLAFNPITGKFDLVNSSSEAEKLVEVKIADSSMSALLIVKATGINTVDLASNDSLYGDAVAFGVLINSVSVSGEVDVVRCGKITDAFFTYPVNTLLFLGLNGTITDIDPSTTLATHVTPIGYGLGSGAIFIDIDKPIIL
jgi:hypothetical protein